MHLEFHDVDEDIIVDINYNSDEVLKFGDFLFAVTALFNHKVEVWLKENRPKEAEEIITRYNQLMMSMQGLQKKQQLVVRPTEFLKIYGVQNGKS